LVQDLEELLDGGVDVVTRHALNLTFNLESPILLFVGMIRSYV